jgi:hypothetical protein
MFSVAKKHGAIHHVSTMNAPQNDHNLPSKNTVENAKPPCKNTPPQHKIIFSCKHRKIKPWESAGKMRSIAFKAMI